MSPTYAEKRTTLRQPNLPFRRVRLFRNNRNQVVRIPMKLELPGQDALIHGDGERLIIEPVRETGLLALIAAWEPLEDRVPDVDETLLPLEPPADAAYGTLRTALKAVGIASTSATC